MKRLLLLVLSALALAAQTRRPLLVISVDGVDQRYLKDASLKIPTIRKLMREGEVTDGVIGVAPTVTWPSHTSMITGLRPADHGILGNRRPRNEGGDYYWTVDLLKGKTKTLWHATRAAGLKSAAITWPVTVDALIDYNLPEAFRRRNGGSMDYDRIAENSTPKDLPEKIRAKYPAFGAQWVDDRARALAAQYIVETHKPDLLLLHFVDLDSEAHDRGPFTREANAILEYTDELIAGILRVTPRNYVVALTSDHGFEHTKRVANPAVLTKDVFVTSGLALARTQAAAEILRRKMAEPDSGILREVPIAEVPKYAPHYPAGAAAFEPAADCQFGNDAAKYWTEPHERGNHGFWPTRPNYRSVLVLWGNGIKPGRKPEMQMTDMAKRFAEIVGVVWP